MPPILGLYLTGKAHYLHTTLSNVVAYLNLRIISPSLTWAIEKYVWFEFVNLNQFDLLMHKFGWLLKNGNEIVFASFEKKNFQDHSSVWARGLMKAWNSFGFFIYFIIKILHGDPRKGKTLGTWRCFGTKF